MINKFGLFLTSQLISSSKLCEGYLNIRLSLCDILVISSLITFLLKYQL